MLNSPRDLLLDLYNFAMAKPEYRSWLKNLAKIYEVNNNIVKSKLWQNQIKSYLLNTFVSLQKKIEEYLNNPTIETKELAKVKEDFSLFTQNLDKFIDAIKNDEDYDQQRNLLRLCKFEVKYRKSAKWDEDIQEFYAETQKLKSEAKSQIFDIFTAFYATDEKEQTRIMQESQKIVSAISKAELALIDRFNELKRNENFLDYSDMEQLAYQILSADTSNSQMAREFYRK